MSRATRSIFGLCSLLLVPTGCEPKNQFKPPPPPQVTVAHPIVRKVADSIEFTGTTRATKTVDLRARVTGYLQKILFVDGAAVERGALLFVIEPAPFRAAVDAAQAELEKAQAALQLARAEFGRTSELVRKRVLTQSDLDVRSAELATAKANVAAAEAALTRARLDLGYTEIRAPINGRIGRHLVDIGNLVQAEQSSLGVIESIDPIYAYFNVSESDLLRFMRMLREHKLPDPEKHPPVLYLGLANEPDFPHQGHLDFRELGVDPGTGTVLRRGTFPNPQHWLIPGLFCRIRARLGEPVPRLLVEEEALGADQRGDFVLVVNEKNIVEYRPVTLGIEVGEMRVLEKGVSETDWIVVNGLLRARPGAKVDPQRTEMRDRTGLGASAPDVVERDSESPSAKPSPPPANQ